MSIRPNPYYSQIQECLAAVGPSILTPWEGYVWRFNAIEYHQPDEVLSGIGALRNGSRWNARGTFPVVYGSTEEQVAVAEAVAHDDYYGLISRKPRLFVCLHFKLSSVLDLSSIETLHALGLRLKDIQAEDWRKLHDVGHESLTQCLGRAAADFGAEGILCRSARVHGGINLGWFPRSKRSTTEAKVCDAEPLRKAFRYIIPK